MSFLDNQTLAWIGLAIVAAIVEVSIPHFGVVFVTLGGIAAAVAAAAGYGLTAQVLVFGLSLGLSLWLIRPRIVAKLGAPGVPSRTELLIGREGIVTHDIETTVGAGRINVGGEDWAASAPTPIRAGTRVRVVAANGIVLEVKPA